MSLKITPSASSESPPSDSATPERLSKPGTESAALDPVSASEHSAQALAQALALQVPDYAAALARLYGRINYEKIGHAPYNANHYRLDRMRQLMKLLGSPQCSYPIVHIAGTKGKGTTATLIYEGLQSSGYRCGLFTSPHLQFLEERIQFNGQICSRDELVLLTRSVLDAAEKLEQSGVGSPTFFELTTAMGFLHFAEQKADCVVLEVGLGGRLDSTNIVEPILSVITSISLDHQAQLGNTIGAIAGEKAGIIKPSVPVISTARHPDARQVIEAKAQQSNSPLALLDRDFHVDWHPAGDNSIAQHSVAQVAFRSSDALPGTLPRWRPEAWQTKMLGRHQADNIAGAIEALRFLSTRGFPLEESKLRAAIAQTNPQARLQIVDDNPTSIIDAAHNPASLTAGLDAIDVHFSGRPKTVLFASSRDKDYRQMLEILLPRVHKIYLTAYQENPRALPTAELFQCATALCDSLGVPQSRLEIAANPASGWANSRSEMQQDGVLFATGSFFLAAELLPLVASRRA